MAEELEWDMVVTEMSFDGFLLTIWTAYDDKYADSVVHYLTEEESIKILFLNHKNLSHMG